MERLTASLEDGTLERLRTLAGGERKVGAFLSEVATWLWLQRDKLADAHVRDMYLLTHTEYVAINADYAALNARMDAVSDRLAHLEADKVQLEIQMSTFSIAKQPQ